MKKITDGLLQIALIFAFLYRDRLYENYIVPYQSLNTLSLPNGFSAYEEYFCPNITIDLLAERTFQNYKNDLFFSVPYQTTGWFSTFTTNVVVGEDFIDTEVFDSIDNDVINFNLPDDNLIQDQNSQTLDELSLLFDPVIHTSSITSNFDRIGEQLPSSVELESAIPSNYLYAGLENIYDVSLSSPSLDNSELFALLGDDHSIKVEGESDSADAVPESAYLASECLNTYFNNEVLPADELCNIFANGLIADENFNNEDFGEIFDDVELIDIGDNNSFYNDLVNDCGSSDNLSDDCNSSIQDAIGGSNDAQNTDSDESRASEKEGATGGYEYKNKHFKDISPTFSLFSDNDETLVHTNYSDEFHDDYLSPMKFVDIENIEHNHTYGLKELPIKKKQLSISNKGEPCSSRDLYRLIKNEIPFSMNDIINASVDEFFDMLKNYNLGNEQLEIIKDIRRRGKNKIAARNCRKRKLDVISNLEMEVGDLQKEQRFLNMKNKNIRREMRDFRSKMNHLNLEIISSLLYERDPTADPNDYELETGYDGQFFLVPRNSSNTFLQTDQEKTKVNNKKQKRRGK